MSANTRHARAHAHATSATAPSPTPSPRVVRATVVAGYCPACGYTASLTVTRSGRLKHLACDTYTGRRVGQVE